MGYFAVSCAARTLRGGGVVAYPTEGVFGLGCDPQSATAVDRVLAIKRRPRERGFVLIAATIDQLAPYVDFAEALPPASRARVEASWPGPVTWVLPARPATPAWITGGRASVAARVTAHPVAAALCLAAGRAIISTSANLSGRRPARSAFGVRARFAGTVDFVLGGELGGLTGPTPIIDALSGRSYRTG